MFLFSHCRVLRSLRPFGSGIQKLPGQSQEKSEWRPVCINMEITKKYAQQTFKEILDILPYAGGFLTCTDNQAMCWIEDKEPSILSIKGFLEMRCFTEWDGVLAWGSRNDVCVMSSEEGNFNILKGHTSTVVFLCTWNGYLCNSSADFTIRMWSKSGDCSFCLFAHTDVVFEMLVFKGTMYSVSGDSKILRWSFKEDSVTQKIAPVNTGQILGHKNTIFCICEWNGRIATGSRDNKIGIWNSNGAFLKFLKGHNDAIKKMVSFEYRLISGAVDGTVCVWNANLKLIQSTWLGWDGISAMHVVDQRVIIGCSDGTLLEMQGN